jgi:hypothetical protein
MFLQQTVSMKSLIQHIHPSFKHKLLYLCTQSLNGFPTHSSQNPHAIVLYKASGNLSSLFLSLSSPAHTLVTLKSCVFLPIPSTHQVYSHRRGSAVFFPPCNSLHSDYQKADSCLQSDFSSNFLPSEKHL